MSDMAFIEKFVWSEDGRQLYSYSPLYLPLSSVPMCIDVAYWDKKTLEKKLGIG